jgi:hypothetical protein
MSSWTAATPVRAGLEPAGPFGLRQLLAVLFGVQRGLDLSLVAGTCRSSGPTVIRPRATGLQAGCLAALAERPVDCAGGGVYAELGFQVCEPVSDRVQAEA